MTDIFISYSRKDKPWVKTLAATLVAEGYDVWWDPEILPGQDYETVIKEALETTKCVLTVWSKDSINSTWVKAESNKGLARNVFVPVLYHDVMPPMQFEHIQAANLKSWKGKTDDPHYQQLLRAVALHTSPSSEPVEREPAKSNSWSWLIGLAVIGLAGLGYMAFNSLNKDVKPETTQNSIVLTPEDTQRVADEKEKAESEQAKLKQDQLAEETAKAKALEEKLKAEQLAEEKRNKLLAEEEAKQKAKQKAQREAARLKEEQLAKEKAEALAKKLKEEKLAEEKKKKKEKQAAEAEVKAKKKAEQLAKEKASQKKQTKIGQYIDHGNGTVTDTKTKLMWKKCSEGLSGVNCNQGEADGYEWAVAIKQGDNANFAGHSDWRLPTIEELRSLVYCSNGVSQKEDGDATCSGKDDDGSDYKRPTINQKTFPNTQSDWYWSSTKKVSRWDQAWPIAIEFGTGSWGYRFYIHHVRLVRSG